MRTLTPEQFDELREIDWYLYYFPERYYASDYETRNKLEQKARRLAARRLEIYGYQPREITLRELLYFPIARKD